MNENIKVFVIYVSSLSLESIYLNKKAQIASLLTEKITVSDKYSDFANVFSEQQALVLPEWIKLKQLAIELQDDKQWFYELIYSLELVELETLKTYIETNLANSFIWLFKLLADTLIFFI